MLSDNITKGHKVERWLQVVRMMVLLVPVSAHTIEFKPAGTVDKTGLYHLVYEADGHLAYEIDGRSVLKGQKGRRVTLKHGNYKRGFFDLGWRSESY